VGQTWCSNTKWVLKGWCEAIYVFTPPHQPPRHETRKGVTHLTTLKQTASTGCKNSKILRWISGGTARKGTFFFENLFQASVATGIRDGRRLVLDLRGGMAVISEEGIVLLVVDGIIDVVDNLSFALRNWRRRRKVSRETRSSRVLM
jgi:hypothetical protein